MKGRLRTRRRAGESTGLPQPSPVPVVEYRATAALKFDGEEFTYVSPVSLAGLI